MPDPPCELAEAGRDQEDDERAWRHGEPDSNRRVAPDVAQKLHVAEEHDREAGAVAHRTTKAPTSARPPASAATVRRSRHPHSADRTIPSARRTTAMVTAAAP